MSKAYYNEIDPFAAQWLRNLIAAGHIAPGDVDTRSIVDVQATELAGYTQCHFFAGIGGWSRAMRLAGWPDDRPVWTGSCPCQPFSSAARGRNTGTASSNHLWPRWFNLIRECRPATIFAEQVAHARAWMDAVCDDMEADNYFIWAAILPAYCVEADHVRERFYLACHAYSDSKSGMPEHVKASRVPWFGSNAGIMAKADGIPGRVGRLRAYGNAIVPQVAAEFIKAYAGA
jgi:DNA (cytosine-5)-methyltransferase 1